MATQMPWEPLIGPAERAAFERARMGGRRPAGTAPALVVVDMNRRFVSDEHPLGVGAAGRAAVDATRGLLGAARDGGAPVFFTTGYVEDEPAARGRWKGAVDRGAQDQEIVPELEPVPGETVLRKRRPSAFFGTDLIGLLTYHGVDTVVVTGITTSGCVRATAVDAFSYNLHVIVPVDCVADRAATSHAISLFDIQMKYGDVIPSMEAVGIFG